MAEEQTQSLNLEVPKVEVDLQSELKEFNTTSLKCVDCQEKVVLPSADGKTFFHHPYSFKIP